MSTTFDITFDFTSDDQRNILKTLQADGYQLLGYKGATGSTSPVAGGLPTWFAEPFVQMFAKTKIEYTPMYQAYACNSAEIGSNTVISMDSATGPIGLGNSLTFNSDGTFSHNSAVVGVGSIQVTNNRPATTNPVTIGLAAMVNGNYAPFCAFTVPPQQTVVMTPHETVCIFAAQTELVSGSVNANVAAPGASFSFSASDEVFPLSFVPGTFALISATGDPSVTPVPSGTTVGDILS